VLVHGIGMRRQAWAPVVELIEAEREVINVDLPGFGQSPPDEAGTALTVSDHADRLQRFFAEAGLSRPHVAGNSMGGGIALELGRRAAVRSLTLISPIGFWGRAGLAWCRAVLGAEYALGQGSPDSMPESLQVAIARPLLFPVAFGRPFAVPAHEVLATAEAGQAAPGFAGGLSHGLDYFFSEPGALRDIPVTVAWGRRDVLLPPITQARRARAMLPWARHLSLPRCGHIPFYDDPERLSRVLLEGSAGG
jgi:pimeloyl-ACP methyl ester carboxylesterase